MVAVVFASLSAAGIVLDPPTSLSLAPHPHPRSQTLPAAAHTSQDLGKTGECQPGAPSFLSLHASGRRPRALLFGTGHVQVSEKVGGREPGEEPAGSGHE